MTPRKIALAAKQDKYYTGVACKHGHVALRYTQSGACVECVVAAANGVTDVLRAERAKHKASLANLTDLKVRAYHADMTAIRGAAIAYARARFPDLTNDDVNPAKKPTDVTGGTGLYLVRVPPEDVEAVRAVALVLLNAHGPDVARERDKILSNVAGYVEQTADPAPEFRP